MQADEEWFDVVVVVYMFTNLHTYFICELKSNDCAITWGSGSKYGCTIPF